MWKLLLRECCLGCRITISLSESSSTRTPSPEIELGERFEFEAVALIDPELEQLNETLEFKEAAQIFLNKNS